MRIAPAMRSLAMRTIAAAAPVGVEAERRADLRLEQRLRTASIGTARSTASSLSGIEPAEHQVGVGDGRPLAAAAVADRPGRGAGALRPDLQHAGVVDARRSSRRRRRSVCTSTIGTWIGMRVLELELGRDLPARPSWISADVGRACRPCRR